jgi:hypothetical protein
MFSLAKLIKREKEMAYKPFTSVNLTYRLENYPSHTPLPHDRIDSAIAGAFAKWQAVSPFTFKQTTSSSPNIRLSFGSVTESKAHAQADANAHTIVFNDSRTWVDLYELLLAKNITTGVLGAGIATPLAPFFAAALVLVRGIWRRSTPWTPIDRTSSASRSTKSAMFSG